jgi:L-ascorbate metabolism protein UlaG (beta-lactamase superfamily)
MARARLEATPFVGSLAERLGTVARNRMTLHWLGQAGSIVTTPNHRLVIDPYLSDSLARKYRDSATPHERLMAPPIDTPALAGIDLVLCTHHHTDHMDGETLRPLAEAHTHLRFVLPSAAAHLAPGRIGVSDERLIRLDAGERIEPSPGLIIQALRAAHETLERNEEGQHRFLGYCIESDGLRLLHSGDTIPYPGQREDISAVAPHLALLPVNGRSERLRALGIAGNLTIAEAIELCETSAIPAMIAHHYGMFAFNTVAPEEIDRAAAQASLKVLRAGLQMEYTLRPV